MTTLKEARRHAERIQVVGLAPMSILPVGWESRCQLLVDDLMAQLMHQFQVQSTAALASVRQDVQLEPDAQAAMDALVEHARLVRVERPPLVALSLAVKL